MRLLTFNSHESYLYDLARVGEPMDVVVDLAGHHVRDWDTRMRPVPENVRLVRLREALASPQRYELVVAHNLTDLLQTKTLPLPKILVLHSSLQGRIEQEGARHRPEDYAAGVRRYLELIRGTLVVVSEHKRASWGIDCPVIPLAVDVGDYGGWTGEEAAGLRVANHVAQKGRYLRWDLHEAAFGGLPWRLVGVNPDRAGVEPARSWDDLRRLLRRHRFYIHTAAPGLEDGYNMSTLEAMATGMPILASCHPTTPVIDGVSGFVSDDPAALRDAARRLLDDREMAREMGAAARQTVERDFPMAGFVARWRELLRQARERF